MKGVVQTRVRRSRHPFHPRRAPRPLLSSYDDHINSSDNKYTHHNNNTTNDDDTDDDNTNDTNNEHDSNDTDNDNKGASSAERVRGRRRCNLVVALGI